MAAFDSRLPESIKPIQQAIGQEMIQESQYQCGQPLLQFGMVNAIPMTSPRMQNQRTCLPGFAGEKRAHTQAQKIEITMKHDVLAINALFEGMWPFSKSPGKSFISGKSLAMTRIMDRM